MENRGIFNAVQELSELMKVDGHVYPAAEISASPEISLPSVNLLMVVKSLVKQKFQQLEKP